MSKLFALPLALVACVDAPSYPRQADPPTTPIASRLLQTVADRPVVVATGGALGVAIDDATSVGWSGDATTGFRVEPFAAWPNTVRPEYWIRALGTGTGSYTISTNHGMAVGTVDSAAVARVTLAPADYQLDGHSAFALAPTRAVVEADLLDATGRRLVDATLVLGEAMRVDASVGSTSWDHLALSSATGRHMVSAAAESFSARELAVDVDGQIDRTEHVTAGDRTCYHAYHGATEIATTWTLEGTVDANATNCVINTGTRLAL